MQDTLDNLKNFLSHQYKEIKSQFDPVRVNYIEDLVCSNQLMVQAAGFMASILFLRKYSKKNALSTDMIGKPSYNTSFIWAFQTSALTASWVGFGAVGIKAFCFYGLNIDSLAEFKNRYVHRGPLKNFNDFITKSLPSMRNYDSNDRASQEFMNELLKEVDKSELE
jgi:hypothetical protein